MGEALERGMVLVMSLWDDYSTHMLWLDGDYPLEADRETIGVQRGPCARDSGNPPDIEKSYPDSSVKYMNIKYGPINSTFNANNA